MTDDIQNNNTAPQTPPVSPINLDEEIKQFEQGFQKEKTEEMPSKISKLGIIKKGVQNASQKVKEEIE